MALRTVFMGTPDFSVPTLRLLRDSEKIDLTLVVSQPDRPAGRGKKLRSPPVITTANDYGIPTFQPEKLDDDASFERVRRESPDLIVVVAYGQILRRRMLELPTHGCVNVHASLLPRWRGAAPIHWAVRAGDAVTGVSIMRMEEGLDTGPVYHTVTHMIREDETAGTLHDALAESGAAALMEALPQIANETFVPVTQPHGRSTYASMLGRDDRFVDFSRSAKEVRDQINGMSPWPGVQVAILGETVNLELAAVAEHPGPEAPHAGSPGEVVAANGDEGLVVACGENSYVRLVRLKRAGKRSMDDTTLLNGFDIPLGTKVEAAS